MSSNRRAAYDYVLERRRAVALAQHYRYEEGLSIAQIADRLGRSPATVKAYFFDPTGEKARAVKARYVGVCRGCGAYTQPRSGKASRTSVARHSGVPGAECVHDAGAESDLGWGARAPRGPRVPHGRLPCDRTAPCGCWPQDCAVILRLSRRLSAQRAAGRAA
jgi:AraC-like DNA-binding protein